MIPTKHDEKGTWFGEFVKDRLALPPVGLVSRAGQAGRSFWRGRVHLKEKKIALPERSSSRKAANDRQAGFPPIFR
jgi:hypothetical protein